MAGYNAMGSRTEKELKGAERLNAIEEEYAQFSKAIIGFQPEIGLKAEQQTFASQRQEILTRNYLLSQTSEFGVL